MYAVHAKTINQTNITRFLKIIRLNLVFSNNYLTFAEKI